MASYDVVIAVLTFGCLLVAALGALLVHPRKRFDGQVFCVSMILYAVLRFVLEYFRADDRGGAGAFTTSQWIGILLIAACAGLWVWFKRLADGKQLAPASPAATA